MNWILQRENHNYSSNSSTSFFLFNVKYIRFKILGTFLHTSNKSGVFRCWGEKNARENLVLFQDEKIPPKLTRAYWGLYWFNQLCWNTVECKLSLVVKLFLKTSILPVCNDSSCPGNSNIWSQFNQNWMKTVNKKSLLLRLKLQSEWCLMEGEEFASD